MDISADGMIQASWAHVHPESHGHPLVIKVKHVRKHDWLTHTSMGLVSDSTRTVFCFAILHHYCTSVVFPQAQRVMKRAARNPEDPNEELEEDPDEKYKDAADEAEGGKPSRGRGRGRGRGCKGKGKGRKGRGEAKTVPPEIKESGTMHSEKTEKAKEERMQVLKAVFSRPIQSEAPAIEAKQEEPGKEGGIEPKRRRKRKNNDEEGATGLPKETHSPHSTEAVKGTPQKKKMPKTGQKTPLKGRSGKKIKMAVDAQGKKKTPKD